MKKNLLCVLLGLVFNGVNSQTLEFTYDGAGNQVKRELVTVNINSLLSSDSIENNNTLLPETNSLKDNRTTIELYPNPVVDLLKVEWNSELQLTQIMLLDNTGKLLQLKKITNLTSFEVFDFSTYASGIYYIRVLDLKQQSKSYKIVKK